MDKAYEAELAELHAAELVRSVRLEPDGDAMTDLVLALARDRRRVRLVRAGRRPASPVAELAAYDGADRLQQLIEGAKREGELTIYTSAQTTDLGPVVEAFEKKYGVKASIWRAGSEAVLNRALQEARAGRHTVDVVETNGPELESMSREQILQAVKSPHHADLIAPAIRPHGEWVGTRLNVFVQAYNTKLVKKEELPKTWEDLADPKWKGKLGIEQEDSDWLAGVFGEIGEERGTKVFQADRRDQRHLGAQGPHAADAARRVGRGAAGAHGLQLQGRAAPPRRRADRLVHHRQRDRAAQRRRRGARARRIRTPPCSSTTSS